LIIAAAAQGTLGLAFVICTVTYQSATRCSGWPAFYKQAPDGDALNGVYAQRKQKPAPGNELLPALPASASTSSDTTLLAQSDDREMPNSKSA
jgi:hypothetical protein